MIICIVGPTGVGKTKLSVELAKKYNAIIINCDAMQVYKELNIVTDKIKPEQMDGVVHHLLDIKTINEDYSVEEYQSNIRRVISEESSSLVRTVLESVVSQGTGKNAYIENYRIGGKTGTAQKVKDGKYMVGNYIVSFIGFLPADKPEYVVYVAIDYPKGVTQYGGTVSAPIAKNIMKNINYTIDFSIVNIRVLK